MLTPGAAAPGTCAVPVGTFILPPFWATALSGTGAGLSKVFERFSICLGGFSFLNSGIFTSGFGGSGGFGCGCVLYRLSAGSKVLLSVTSGGLGIGKPTRLTSFTLAGRAPPHALSPQRLP